MITLPFVDAHFHPLQIAYFRKAVDLSSVSDSKSLVMKLSNTEGPIIGYHFVEYEGFAGGEELTKLFPSTPVVVIRTCLHKLWMNTLAVSKFASDLNVRDDGSVIEDDVWVVIDRVFNADVSIKKKIIKDMFIYLFSLGIVGGVEMGVSAESAIFMEEIASEVGFEYFYFLKHDSDPLDCIGKRGCLGVKLFADGSLGARTAALEEPYLDGEGTGVLNWKDEELYSEISKWHIAGYDASIHVIGDRALRQVLTLFREVLVEYPRPHRHRVEHLQVLYPGSVEHISSLGIYASIQPTFSREIPWALKRLGGERMAYAYRWKELINIGQVLIGTDAPVYGVEPIDVIDGLVNPQYWRDSNLEPANVSYGKALDLYTKGNMEYLGLITDLDLYRVVWERFPYKPKQVVVRGKVVYEN